MENATKALLIAGAVAVTLLILSLGMYFYNSATDGIDLSKLSQAQKDEFNRSWQMYEGAAISGSQVNNLIQQVINSNTKEHKENTGKVIDLTVSKGQIDTTFTGVNKDGTIKGGTGISSKIKTGLTYNVEVNIGTEGLVDTITIN